MMRSFWKIHCEGWFGSSELAADGSAEAEQASTQSSLAPAPLPPNTALVTKLTDLHRINALVDG
jgi:hypothetical protein